MAKAPPSAPPPTRLYLATPVLAEPDAILDTLAAVLDAADIAALLLNSPARDERTLIRHAKQIGALVQPKGVALLLNGHWDLVARAGADGSHVTGVARLREAMDVLRPDRICGVGGLLTRHDAMLAGEAGADYVLFGEAGEDGAGLSPEQTAERVSWWAAVFEPPCVGYAGAPEEIATLARAGADFVLVGPWIWSDPRGAQAALVDAAAALRQADPIAIAATGHEP